MGATALTVLNVVSVLASAVGAGMSYHASSKAADTQEQLAMLNAQAQTQAARQQGRAGAMQAEIQARLAAKDQEAAEANAEALQKQAEAGSRAANDNTRRSREEIARVIGAQRAAIARSGLSDTTGTPLDLLMESAREEQRMADAARYEDENARRSLFREAAVMRNQGTMAGIAGISALAGGAAAQANAAAAVSQARLDAFSQRAMANAARSEALGSLLTSAGGIAKDAYNTPWKGGSSKKATKPIY